ncbi:MAG: autotransporter outer membrane beta-barrel domain-containing protein [Planctomycetaceae bacterium]|nr:autotransporter outer membrane beta-barrel domain-containing protein [Planctomycetaceae bacterium]
MNTRVRIAAVWGCALLFSIFRFSVLNAQNINTLTDYTTPYGVHAGLLGIDSGAGGSVADFSGTGPFPAAGSYHAVLDTGIDSSVTSNVAGFVIASATQSGSVSYSGTAFTFSGISVRTEDNFANDVSGLTFMRRSGGGIFDGIIDVTGAIIVVKGTNSAAAVAGNAVGIEFLDSYAVSRTSVVGTLRFDSIAVDNYTGGDAAGIEALAFSPDSDSSLGSIRVFSKAGNAYGIHLHESGNFTITNNIAAVSSGTATTASAVFIEDTSPAASTITLDTTANAALFLTAAENGTAAASIDFSSDASASNVLNIQGSETFSNNNQAFIVRDVDKVQIDTNTVLRAGSDVAFRTAASPGTITVSSGLWFAIDEGTLDSGNSNVDIILSEDSEFGIINTSDQTIGSVNFVGSNTGGGFLTKYGSGTLTVKRAADFGYGQLALRDGDTKFQAEVNAGSLDMYPNSILTLAAAAAFNEVYIEGNIRGNNTADAKENLHIIDGGYVTAGGSITGIDSFTFGEDGGSAKTLTVEVRSGTAIDTGTLSIGDNDRIVFRGANGTYTNIITTTEVQTQASLDRFKVTAALKTQEALANAGDNTNIDIRLATKTVAEYIGEKYPHRRNANRIGTLTQGYMDVNENVRNYIENVDAPALDRIFNKLSAGELAADAMRMPLWKPYRAVFRHLDEVAPLNTPFTYYWGGERTPLPYNIPRSSILPQPGNPNIRGQKPSLHNGYNFWFDTHIIGGDAANRDSDAMYGYDTSRWGMMLGGDADLFHSAVAGFVFGYGTPQMKNRIGKVSADDTTFGLYLRMPVVWDIAANAFVGYGHQGYDLTASGVKRSFGGSSMYGSIEFSKTLAFQCGMQFKPLLAFEWQSADADGFPMPVSEGSEAYPAVDLDALFGSRHLGQTNSRLGVDMRYRFA